jgi:uncharacterized membrane protein
MFVLGAVTWPVVPDSIPVHWNASGQADRFGGKIEGLFLLPALTAAIVIVLRVLPRLDPRRARYPEFAGTYALIRLAIPVVMAGIYLVIILSIRGVPVRVGPAVTTLAGLLLAVIGGFLDRVKPNWFVGIRTPWTLSSERSWNKTHRVGHWAFMAMGAAIVVAGLLQSAWAFVLAGALCALTVVGLAAYSYVVWRDDPARLSHPGRAG